MTGLAARLLAWLLPGPIGEEARRDLEAERQERAKRGRATAALWYASFTVRPSTWMLARVLRRPSGADSATSRSARPRGGSGISWIDVKLGLRLLAKHPMMTLVSGLAISVTIAVALGTFSVFQDFLLRPTLPLDEGDRVVSLGLLNTRTARSDWRLLHDFEVWREELGSIEDLAIWRGELRNVVTGDGRVEPLAFTRMTASGFRVARVPPLLGRPLLESDEIEGAPPVVVLGHREWTTRFGADADIVGRRLEIGGEPHTVVGVMPEGFTFPVSSRFWLPFQDDADQIPIQAGQTYYVFGRLRPGVTAAEAQAELDVISARRAAELPATHASLLGKVMSYTDPHTGMDNAEGGNALARIVLAVLSLVVLLPFVNVAILIYARTATRTAEISVRTALGASRRRVVTQLFVEALVLATVSAGAGIGIAFLVLDQIDRFMDLYLRSSWPFWAKNGRDPWAMAYVVGLTMLAAVVAGVIPGLKATGSNVHANIRAAGNGMRLGKVWTTLIVTQVAITVAFLPVAGSVARAAMGVSMAEPHFAEEEYVTAMVDLDGSVSGNDERPRALDELVRRLESDSRVEGVALSTRLPGAPYSSSARIDVEGFHAHEGRGYPVGTTGVSPNLFDVLDMPIAAGRAFTSADVDAEVRPVIVDETFVREVLRGANPLGVRLRAYPTSAEEPEAWSEIVGVAPDLLANPTSGLEVAGMLYRPLSTGDANTVRIVVHAPSASDEVAVDLPRMAANVDPNFSVSASSRMSLASDPIRVITLGLAAIVALVLLSVLLLCSAGVFALMSFNVTQRRREIGIRSALGASPERVLARVLARAAHQLTIGVGVGVVMVALMPPFSIDGLVIEVDETLIAVVAALLVAVGMVAAAGPTREGLRVQPTEALKEA